MEDYVIEMLHITKEFPGIIANDDITLQLKRGEIHALLGENGAGKSTLLRILSTMLIPCEGNAEINGFDLLKNPDEVRKNIGILFGSEVGLYERLTAEENLEYFAKLNGMSPQMARERTNELAERFSFSQYQNKQVGTLSKGMKQKVAIALTSGNHVESCLYQYFDS